MAKKSMIEREVKRQKLINKYYDKRKSIKSNLKRGTHFDEQLRIQQTLQKLPRNSSAIRSRKRCWVTGRSRGYFRDFGLSRHTLREMAHKCLIPGLIKSSW